MTQQQPLGLLTIGTVNHAAGIRVVLDTFSHHHPEARVFTCLVDGHTAPTQDLSLPGIVFAAADMVLPGGRRFLFKFDAFELCCALKPFAASFVLERYGIDRLVYLDSDIMVFAPLLDALAAGWGEGRILCTPHFIDWPKESPEILRQMRQCGTYNAGFFAVERSEEATRFLSWWAEVCTEMGLYDPPTGRFVDQIWLDLVTAERHGFALLLDPGLNVGYWNLSERQLVRDGSRWLVNGEPLKFFHFSGFDPTRLTGRRAFSPSRAHLEIGQEYESRLVLAGVDELREIPYGFATYSDGHPITLEQRRAIFWNRPGLATTVDPFLIRAQPGAWRAMLRATGAPSWRRRLAASCREGVVRFVRDIL